VRASVGLLAAIAAVLVAVGEASGEAGSTGAAVGTDCTASAAKNLVREFISAYSGGRVAAADRVWAPAPRFQWFSTGPPGARLGARAYNRSTLGSYFRTRARAHEKLRLVQLRAGYDAPREIVNFAGRLVRSASDIAPRRLRDFKGAADCLSRRPMLIVWSM